jgi:hypothetical protein
VSNGIEPCPERLLEELASVLGMLQQPVEALKVVVLFSLVTPGILLVVAATFVVMGAPFSVRHHESICAPSDGAEVAISVTIPDTT